MMGYELDMTEADERLRAGVTRAFTEFFADIPQGTVREIDETGDGFVRLSMTEPDGEESTWLLEFRVGQSVEITRIG